MFLVHLLLFDYAFTCTIVIQMVLVVTFLHSMSPFFLTKCWFECGLPLMVSHALCLAFCSTYIVSPCCATHAHSVVRLALLVCVFAGARLRSVLLANTSATAKYAISNSFLISEGKDALCVLAGFTVAGQAC